MKKLILMLALVANVGIVSLISANESSSAPRDGESRGHHHHHEGQKGGSGASREGEKREQHGHHHEGQHQRPTGQKS